MMGDNAGCLGLSHSAVNSDDQHVKQQQMFAWAARDELHVGPTLWAIARCRTAVTQAVAAGDLEGGIAYATRTVRRGAIQQVLLIHTGCRMSVVLRSFCVRGECMFVLRGRYML